MWTAGLREWFVANGRHDLPWRLTTDPWAVLVSEVMLQQTSVARVLPRWEHFMARWPTARACAAAPLAEVLREWQGLGYPRRARALWLLAAAVTERGWPGEEAGLRALPGVGTYTARALLAFTELATAATAPPRDVNLGRVAARAALGREPHQVPPATLDGVLREGRPARHADARVRLCALRRRRPALPGAPALRRLPAGGGVRLAGARGRPR